MVIDPARRLHETRNARRHSDVATILDAVRIKDLNGVITVGACEPEGEGPWG